MPTTGEASLYFHVPFCTKKCPYCHFYVIPSQPRYHALLAEGFSLEWAMQKPKLQGYRIASIYFGGGTPALYGAQAIGETLSWIDLSNHPEITVETNPEEADFQLFYDLKQVGVNRISLGVQSLDDRSLQTLGRSHSAKRAQEAIFAAKKAGIDNISIDLMYDLPDQTPASWSYTLDQLQSLPITHISLYNLTIEPHTSFYRNRQTLNLPRPEESLRYLQSALDKFADLQFKRYEISAFARHGYESRHNLGYWTFRPFLGLGPSAFSYWDKSRFQNTPNLQRYVRALKQGQSPVHFSETLDYPADVKEMLAVGLRLVNGVKLPSRLPNETYKAIENLQEQALLVKTNESVRLTERGMLFYDSIASEIV